MDSNVVKGNREREREYIEIEHSLYATATPINHSNNKQNDINCKIIVNDLYVIRSFAYNKPQQHCGEKCECVV